MLKENYKMKYFLVCCILYVTSVSILAQNTRGVAPEGGKPTTTVGNTWAVIVGISDYQNPNIPDLSYSDKDALAFAQYLKSPAGGKIPDDHITCLINEKATAGQFASSLDWLIEKTKEGDQVIIFFAGHGDVERKTLTQPGFLLCWDAPSKVYMGGGTFGLVYLQEIISTLSLQTKAKVWVITDACRSGKLAGSEIGGTQATASNLAKQFANEVKLMSCQPDELSLEGPNWGGGRGLFSYYLIQGLTGLADLNNDGKVTLFEIEKFLSDKVPEAALPRSQIPMAIGAKSVSLSNVDATSLSTLQKSNPDDDKLSIASKVDPSIANDKNTVPPIANAKLDQFNKALESGRLLYPEDNSAWSLYQQLKDDKSLANEWAAMKSKLAAAFQDEAQQAINDYLKADPKELKKRWNFDDRYEKFPVYLNKAAELLGESHFLYKDINARAHYFSGLNLRLAGERKKDTLLYKKAFIEQFKVIALDSNAAYAYNELGLLERRTKNYAKSIVYFNKAHLCSPKWVFPIANLAAIYYDLDSTTKAIEYGIEAIRIDPESPLAHLNLAAAYELNKEYSKAKVEYAKTIQLDPSEKDSRINLCFMYYLEKDYIEAEKIIKEYKLLYPNDVNKYINAALCIHLAQGEETKAFELLESEIKKGFRDFKLIEEEPELKSFILNSKYIELKSKNLN